MKKCTWCEKDCLDNEEGAFEVAPDDDEIELGWICNHCADSFMGTCECEECVESEERAQEAVRKLEIEQPKITNAELFALACITAPIWLLPIVYIMTLFL